MDDSQRQSLRNYAWGYFAFHAEQRMKAVHFYLILSTVLVTGFINGIKNTDNYFLFAIVGFVLALISFFFKRLDERNKELVRNGEAALKFLDSLEDLENVEEQPNVLKIFEYDDYTIKKKQEKSKNFSHFSYSTFLNYIFLTFGLLGFVTGILCLLHLGFQVYTTQNESTANIYWL